MLQLRTAGFLFLILLSTAAQARVFNLTQEKFGSYLRLSGGPLAASDDLFLKESAADQFSKEFKQNISGEFGFVTVNGPFSLRFGFEVLRPSPLKDVTASNGTTDLYEVSRDLSAMIPKIGLDVNLVSRPKWRLFASVETGQAHLTIKNKYRELGIAPNADFDSEWKGQAQSLSGGMGVEYAAFDLTSVVLEIGYRQLKYTKLTYSQDITDLQGAHRAGDRVLLTDGENRQLNLSGMTVSLGARWWLF